MKIQDFISQAAKKISMVTCYDYTMAAIIAHTTIDCVLVGDSAGMVMHGYSSTLPMTVEQMAWHTAAVVRGCSNKFIIADMPFLSYSKGLPLAMEAVAALMQVGANAIKVEGAHECAFIRHCVDAGVPVMGHLGLTPQSVHQLGGYRVQAVTESAAADLLADALCLQQAGCFAIVLECVPASVAAAITQQLAVATIGIGAGPDTTGQVLVLHDLLGMTTNLKPTFVKAFCDGAKQIGVALNAYDQEVKQQVFPQRGVHTFERQEIT